MDVARPRWRSPSARVEDLGLCIHSHAAHLRPYCSLQLSDLGSRHALQGPTFPRNIRRLESRPAPRSDHYTWSSTIRTRSICSSLDHATRTVAVRFLQERFNPMGARQCSRPRATRVLYHVCVYTRTDGLKSIAGLFIVLLPVVCCIMQDYMHGF